MDKIVRTYVLIVIFIVSFALVGVVGAADWPQWRGPNRDGKSSETGLLKKWPESGPELLWEGTGLGTGYSSLAIVGNRLYTMGDLSIGDQKRQYIIFYDLTTRKRSWIADVGPPHSDGSRCAPTLSDGLVYAIGTEGDLLCVDADTGRVQWQKNLQKDLGGGPNPRWKYSESPLVDGDRLLCTPGGHISVMVALNKKTGELIWSCRMSDIGPKGRDEAGYSSIVTAEVDGIRQYVQLTNEGLIGVAADPPTSAGFDRPTRSKFLWGYNKIANRTASVSTPVVDGRYVFCSTAYETGSALLELSAIEGGVNAKEIYFLGPETFQSHHGGFVLVDGYIYGGHGHNAGKPTCLEMKRGKVMWQQDQPGNGSAAVIYADGHLYFRYQDNTVALIEANPKQYVLKSVFKVPKRPGGTGRAWAHPVISDGKLYIRHADVLFCYDVRGSEKTVH